MPAITVEVLPGGRGDCLWIECLRPGGRPWRLLFDGGMPHSWEHLRTRIETLPTDDRHIDLAVVSHIDADHIGGMLPLLATPDLGVSFGDIWFNAKEHIPAPENETRSVAQGERLADLLSGTSRGPALAWNEAFDRGPVTTGANGAFREVRVEGWPGITLLSPTDQRLAALGQLWAQELDKVRGDRSDGEQIPEPPLAPLDDLESLAAVETTKDRSVPNGSSIAFLLEHRGTNCLLTGDAHFPVLGAALTNFANARDGEPIDVDLYKVSHHGSNGNVTTSLLTLTPARHYVVSTDGSRFHHPDDTAMARIVTTQHEATLWFNYGNSRNERWDSAALKKKWGYEVVGPRDADVGVTIELEGRT